MTWSERWRSPGGGKELLALAFPFILSNSFWTLQITIDRVFLGWWGSDAVGAATAAVMMFWTLITLFQNTAAYATTFVAQYVGAGQPEKVATPVWQSLYFSFLAGNILLLIYPMAGWLMSLGEHSHEMQQLEVTYLQCMTFSALPTLLVASVGSFFSGKGDSWTVLLINAVGLVVNAGLDYAWIFGHFGFPAMGIAGAGWATVAGTWSSALLGLALMFRRKYRIEHGTLRNWRFDLSMFLRLLRFGLPSGFQWFLDGIAFTVFLFLIGRIGNAELTASSVAFTLNMIAFLPSLGIGQAVTVLVGQRLGENRPELAQRSTWTGFYLVWIYMAVVAVLYLAAPGMFLRIFLSQESGGADWIAVAALIPPLLRFVAIYSLFDSANLVFSFALKGAGDTRFVMLAALGLSWTLMVLPTIGVMAAGGGIFWAWTCVSAYVIALAFVLLWRFRQGKWKSMRVVEIPVANDTIAGDADVATPDLETTPAKVPSS